MTGWLLGEAANEAALGLVLKVTLVLAGGLAATLLLRRATAALRHATLAATLVAAMTLPVLSLFLPAWNVPLFDASASEAPSRDARSIMAPPDTPSATADGSTVLESSVVGSPGPARHPPDRPFSIARTASRPNDGIPWMALLLGGWAVGLGFGLGRAGLDLARMRALVREAVYDPSAPQALRSRRMARQLGIRRPVRLLFSERLSVPVTWGVLRPVVVLPIEAWDWDTEKSRIVLLHELAHVRRLDWLSWGLMEAARCLWWFHPLEWLCRRRLRVEQERACDDVVLLGGIRPTDYAAILVEFARGVSRMDSSSTARAAIAMARPSTLGDRIETILAAGSRTLRLERRTAALLAAAVAALVIPLAAVHLWGETTEARETARLIASLESDEPRTREVATWSLGARGSEEAVEPLIERLADGDARVRGVAARALGKIGEERAFDAVARLLQDPDPRVRELAAQGLAEIEHEGRVAALTPMLDDPDVEVRSVTVAALGQLEKPGTVEALTRAALHDPDPHTRWMAIDALGKRGVGARAVVPALVRLLEEEPGFAPFVAPALGEIGDERAVPALVAHVGAEDAEVRESIVRALAAFAAEPTAVDGLLAALRDPEWQVRSAAAEALGQTRDRRAVAALLDALRDPVHQVRLHATWALEGLEASGVR